MQSHLLKYLHVKNRLSHVGNNNKKIKNEIVALFQPIEKEGGFPLYARARERESENLERFLMIKIPMTISSRQLCFGDGSATRKQIKLVFFFSLYIYI